MALLMTGLPITLMTILFIGSFALTDQHGKLSVMLFSLIIFAYSISIFRYHESVNLVALSGTALTIFGIFKCVNDH